MANALDVRRMGLAFGGAAALFYLGCVFVMLTAPQETVIQFFNSILHGWDVAPLMRWQMPWWEAVLGIIEIFVLGWLFGALVAVLYNVARPGRA